jgi:thiol-disulfide isomerase/thioredoxin
MVAVLNTIAVGLTLLALGACAAPLESAEHPALGTRSGNAVLLDHHVERADPLLTTVVEFWALDCPPCRERVPRLVALRNELLKRRIGLVLVAVLDDEQNPADAAARLASWGLPPVTRTVSYAAAEAQLKLGALPETWVLDQTGRLVWVAPTSARVEDIIRAASRWSRP